MGNADKLFYELGYTKVVEDDIKIWYTGTTIKYTAEIMLWKITKTFDLVGENWSMQELKAINMIKLVR